VKYNFPENLYTDVRIEKRKSAYFALEDEETMIGPDKIRVLGDIYICIEKVKSQAEEYNHSFKRELTFLTVHGLLHLLGYDHMNKEDEIKMFKKQEEVLNYYGIIR